ncbi:MAG: ATP-binding protein, partial [Acidobacteriota bacterium]|nr:ATP-binding protein [Acidobacteriota bacterium]
RVEDTAEWEHARDYEHFEDGFLVARFPHDRGDLRLQIIDTMESEVTERYMYIRDSARFLEVNRAKTRQLTGLNQTLLLMTTFTILFGGIWTALALSKRFLDAFNVFITGARQVSEGNLDTHLALETGDEMEDVLDAFNMMTSRLKENQGELEEKARQMSRVNAELTGQIQYTQTILQQTNAGVLSTDNFDRITTFNPAVLRILEMDEVAAGTRLTEWLVPNRHAALLQRWTEFKKQGKPTQYSQMELRNEETGKIRYVAATIVPLENDEITFGNLVILEDLTQLLNAQRLAAWREVAKRVAHEIKNPLTPIQLSIQRIERKARKGAPDLIDAIHSAHETIMNETDLLKNLVNEFSTFAKLPGPTLAPTDLGELVQNVRDTYAPVYPNIQLHCESEDIHYHCDAGQIRQVLSNLINNAATAAGGKGNISVRLARNGGDLHLTVSDDGKGIPRGEREKVFLPYYSKSPKGTGLGLAIVKRIVEDHRGSIAVRDNEPKGTVFEITLPEQ